MGTEYFAGPFASWINVKSAPYSAAGNGTNDDTAALQEAINAASSSNSVVYLPAGTYKISAPLTVQNQYGFSFIGASPAATTIVWSGPVSGTMMWVLSTGSSSWGRITWEGSNSAAIGVGHTCTDSSCSTGTPPTYNRHFDEVFQDMGKGIAGGVNQTVMNSEMTITRCTFRNCTYAGLSVESYNALDYWVWDCQFFNNARGLTNDVIGGNFMAYRCLFEGSTIADLKFSNVEFFSFRDNVSIGSNQFINGLGSNSSVETNIQGNRVVNTINPTAIYLNDLGPAILVDNQIESQSGATAPAVELLTPNGGDIGGPDLVSIGNQYTVSNPITVIGQVLAPGQNVRWWSQEDQTVAYGSISSALPAMPPLPTSLTTNITDIAAGAVASVIQAAINADALLNPGVPAVIHLPAGSYNLNQTLNIPANLNLMIVGDGLKTQLNNSSGSGSLFLLSGPSKTTIRDMNLSGGGSDVIQVQGADQPGARVFGDGLYMNTNHAGDLLADNLTNTQVVMQGFEPLRAGTVSVKAIGTGSPSSSFVGIYGGAASDDGGIAPTNGWMYEVSNGGRLLVQDSWYESGDSPTALNLTSTDSGVFTYSGGSLGSGTSGLSVNINGFNGLTTFLGLSYGIQTGGGISVTPSSQTQAWFLGQAANQPSYFTETGSSGAVYLDNSQGLTAVGGTNQPLQIPDQPANSLPVPTPPAFPASFVDNMLALARSEQLPPLTDLPLGVTDARFYRLSINNGGIGLHITANNSGTTPVSTPTTGMPSPTPTRTMTSTPSATGTPTPTQTRTATATATASTTSTPTFTASWTASFTASATPSPTNSPTASSTASATATGTATATPTKTNSPIPPTATNTAFPPTATSTATASMTASPTNSWTPSATASPTSSPSPSRTPTASSTSTASATATLTPSATWTATYTATSTSSPSYTPTASSTPSATASSTALPTKTNSPVPPTATNTPVPPTASGTPSPTSTGTASATASWTSSSTPSRTPTASSTPSATGTATASPTKTDSPMPPTATATAVPPTSTATLTASMTPSPTNTATASATASSTGSPTPSSTLSAIATGTATSSPTKTNSPVPPTATNTAIRPTFTATSTPSMTPTVTTTGTASATASPISSPSPTPTPTASTTSTASTTTTPTFTVSWTPTSTVSATPSSTATGTETASPTKTNSPVPPTATPSMTPSATDTWTATASFTPSVSPTYSPALTPNATLSPTFTPGTTISNPYPNPSTGGPVNINIDISSPSTVILTVFTLFGREIYQESLELASDGTISWNLADLQGTTVANGVYYLKIQVNGNQPLVKVLKVLVLR